MRLGDVTTVRRSIVPIEDIADGKVTMVERVSFDGEIFAGKEDTKMEQFLAVPGDLVISKIRARQGSVGLVSPDSGNVSVTIHYRALTPNIEKINEQYAWLVLRLSYARAQFLAATGGAMKGEISEEALLDIRIPLPPLEMQRAIVARWKAAQAEVKTLDQQAIVVEEQSRRDFEAALGLADLPGLGDLAGLRPRVFALWWSESDRWSVEPNRLRKLGFQETPQSHYPSLPISTFGEVIYGLQVCPEREPRDHPTPYLRVANVQRGYLDLTEIKQIEVAPQELARYRLEPGDVLLCEGNSAELVGRGAIWQGEIEGCVHQNHVLRVRLDLQKALPEYVLAYINSSAGQTYFRSKAKRTTNLASINSREVGRMPVPLPPLDVQREIVRRVEESRAEIARLRAQAARRAQEAQVEVEAAILGSEDLPGF